MNFPKQWNLSTIFQDGNSRSPELKEFLGQLELDLTALEKASRKGENIPQILQSFQTLTAKLHEAQSFILCLTAGDVQDTLAIALQNKMTVLQAKLHEIMIGLEKLLLATEDSDFMALLEDPSLAKIAFPLTEIRDYAKEKLPTKEEQLINDLAIDGYHGMSGLYDLFIGEMKFPFQKRELSFGQIENKTSDPSRKVRKEAFEIIEKKFDQKKIIFAEILNHISGFRLKMYQHRDWTSVLKEPLHENRLEEKTLSVMWETIENSKEPLVSYMKRKAQILGLEKLAWYDLEAPLKEGSLTFAYDKACTFIIDHFRSFSPKMASFAEMALTKGWVEAEDRSGKKPGGFYTDFPVSKQGRIFMTFSGTFINVSTLAHELGHAFHSFVMQDLPELATHYRMNVAETASTMAEMIVIDAAIQAASAPEEKLLLLDDKISRSVAFLMNLHARFLFETTFYDQRKTDFLSAENLSSLMLDAQKAAYKNSLSVYHPLFWAAKLHFYFTDVPFYNFPYTFGYLFSLGIYHAAKNSQNFEDKYILLLQDSGRMTTENLAKKHLGIDLTNQTFWKKAISIIHDDIQQFLTLTKSYV